MMNEMSCTHKLKIHFEFGELKVDLEGDPDTVTRELFTYLNKIYPALEMVKRLSFAPDLAELSTALVGIIKFAPEGIILENRELSAEQAILICLLGGYVGYKLGRGENDSMSASTLSKDSGKALKTISNQVALMADEGLVEKMGKGEYRITSLGIKRAEAIIGGLK
ncbi:hypothetical protein MUP77_05370 [Candidatus Bathyarchaeota archaeon]|nr:hypothetical protein [Candidatus Bathyarchaeota archaeon]